MILNSAGGERWDTLGNFLFSFILGYDESMKYLVDSFFFERGGVFLMELSFLPSIYLVFPFLI